MFRSLRFKIMYGYILVGILLLLYNLFAIYHLGFLQRSVDMVLRENYRSIICATDMTELLERLDSMMWSIFSEHPIPREDFDKYREVFLKTRLDAAGNITVMGEEMLLKTIEGDFNSYVSKAEELFSLPAEPRRLDFFIGEIQPEFRRLKDEVRSLLILNQNHMYDVEQANRDRARRTILAGIVTSFLTILFGIFFGWLIGYTVVRPISRLTAMLKSGKKELDGEESPLVTGSAEIDELTGAVLKRLKDRREHK